MTAIAIERRGTGAALWWIAPAVAASLALLGALVGWRGVDLPAQLYRVTLFQHHGLTLWDSQWYGGHWTLGYSVVYPPIAGILGVTVTAALSAAGAAWAFDRLAVGHFGRVGHLGSVLFAVGTVVQLAIGQLPFMLGEAFALGACWAASRRRWPLAVALAVATSLASPLAGAFLALAGVAWFIAGSRHHRIGLALVVAGVVLPIGVAVVLFPGQGAFPYPFADMLFELPAAVIMWMLVPRHERALRIAAGLYIVAIAASFLVSTPMGGNVGRLGECVAIPIGACVMWPRRRQLFVLLALPMAVWQWSPAWGAIVDHNTGQPSTHVAYYQPLIGFLARNDAPIARVEVVPTAFHWEAAYVAPSVALARGWERQLDIADNALFYDKGALDAASYLAWLVDSGVRYVALPDAPLDFAAKAEAGLVSAGVPGLRPVWSNAHWRVFEVVGSTGIVEGPARLVSVEGGHTVLDITAPGIVLLRVRYTPRWTVSVGHGCLHRAAGGWTALDVGRPGPVELQIRLATAAQPDC